MAAIKAGGLADTWKGPGPFTVFAPTDEAFAKLPPDTLESLLMPENKTRLQSILTYHVVGGNVLAKDLLKLPNGLSRGVGLNDPAAAYLILIDQHGRVAWLSAGSLDEQRYSALSSKVSRLLSAN